MSESLQYKRTDKAIVNAFMSLCMSEGFEKITIKEILEEALVSRNTFYAHYKDKYEIAEKLFDEFMTEFQQMLDVIYKERKISIFTKSQSIQSQELNKIYEDFRKRNIQKYNVLCSIKVPDINLNDAIKSLFRDRYMSNSCNLAHGENCLIEAELYGAIQSSMSGLGFSMNKDFAAYTLQINDAMRNAFIYSLGIRNPDSVKEVREILLKYRMAELSDYN